MTADGLEQGPLRRRDVGEDRGATFVKLMGRARFFFFYSHFVHTEATGLCIGAYGTRNLWNKEPRLL